MRSDTDGGGGVLLCAQKHSHAGTCFGAIEIES